MTIPEKREEITLAWFNSIFKSHGITVHSFTFTGETGVGRGYMGTLEQVELNITRHPKTSDTEKLHVVLKTSPTDPMRKSYATNDGFSSREVSVYKDIFPAWEKFLDSHNVPSSSRFRYPICYYAGEEGEGDTYRYILVLENVSIPVSTFHLWDGGFNSPLPWDDVAAVIQQLARLHATGIAYKIENKIDSYYNQFPKLNHVVSPMFHIFWEKGFEIMKQVIEEVVNKEDVPAGLFEHLDKIKEAESRDLLLKWYTDKTMFSGDIATFVHQDLHSNNLALRDDHSSVVLFDYQAACEFNPMKELTFFLILSCELEVATKNLSRALQVYHDEFAKLMEVLNPDFKYTLDKITRDYDKFLSISVAHIMTGAQVWIIGPDSTEESKRRFAAIVIDTYKRGVLNFPTRG